MCKKKEELRTRYRLALHIALIPSHQSPLVILLMKRLYSKLVAKPGFKPWSVWLQNVLPAMLQCFPWQQWLYSPAVSSVHFRKIVPTEILKSSLAHCRVGYNITFRLGKKIIRVTESFFSTMFFAFSSHIFIFFYLTNNFQKALQEYSSISEKLPPTNFAMKRDVEEGQARCLVRLGRHAEALAMAANLVSSFIAYFHLFPQDG